MKERITNQILNQLNSKTIWIEGTDEQNTFEVAISKSTTNFCVGIVDIANSTRITAKLPPNKAASYYEIFLNTMARIIKNYDGVLVKNAGDSLLFCFPESTKSKKYGLMTFLECVLSMAEEHDDLEEKYHSEGLPSIDYRISADYGNMLVMKSNSSSSDLIGTPVNICSKINPHVPVNGVGIGGDLHEMIKDIDGYYCKGYEAFSVGLKNSYPIYSLRRKS